MHIDITTLFYLDFRLTPSYAYLLFFFTYILPVVGSGPSWFMNGPHGPLMENCISYWWTNLLYINNFYPELQYQVSVVFETLFFKYNVQLFTLFELI